MLPTMESIALPDRFGEGDIAGLEIELGFGRRAEAFGAVVVDLAFPSRDDNRCQAVGDEVYAGATGELLHERMHARALWSAAVNLNYADASPVVQSRQKHCVKAWR